MQSDTVYRTIREQIAEHIRSEVLSGQLTEGDPLREEELAARFGVSRGPVRDAILQLSQEGLLTTKPNCGARVSSPPGEPIRPLIVDLRRRIEIHALRRGFSRLGGEMIDSLEAATEALRAACKANNDVEASARDLDYHRLIVESAGDADLIAVWNPITTRMMLRYTRPRNLLESYEEHADILKAIREGDRKTAVAALKANIR